MPSQMNMLNQFEQVTVRFGRTAGIAIGGASVVPIITAFSGMAPSWPDGLPIMSSLLMLITLMVTFHFFTAKRRWVFSTFFTLSVLALVSLLITYTYLRARFIMLHPASGEPIILGCEWRSETKVVAVARGLSIVDQCPGDFRGMLLDARDQFDIWTEASILQVSLLIASVWTGIFVSLATAIGSFVIWYAKQSSTQEPQSDAP